MNTRLEDLFPFCCQQINESKQKQFEVLLSERVRNTVNAHSLLRRLGEQKILEQGEEARYKTTSPSMLLPRVGAVPMYFSEVPDELYVPTISLGTSIDFDIKYVSAQRMDICDRAVARATNAIIDYEEECLFIVLVATATSNKYKQLHINKLNMIALKKIIRVFEDRGKTLTHLLVSKDEIKDLQNEGFPVTTSSPRRIVIPTNKKAKDERSIEIIPVPELGLTGRYNINHTDSTWGRFKTREGKFNEYKPNNSAILMSELKVSTLEGEDPNIEPKLNTPGETQVYALSLPEVSSIKVPIRKEIELFPDTALHRQQKLGYYGWEEIGIAITDMSDMQMIVIDRY